jgi:hypothetical protein
MNILFHGCDKQTTRTDILLYKRNFHHIKQQNKEKGQATESKHCKPAALPKISSITRQFPCKTNS